MNEAGVYCIKIDGEIVYIGASKDVKSRWFEHKINIDCKRHQAKNMYEDLYNIEDKSRVSFEVLLTAEELENYEAEDYEDWKDQRSMLDHAEFVLISLYKPKYNTQGVDKPYRKCTHYRNCQNQKSKKCL